MGVALSVAMLAEAEVVHNRRFQATGFFLLQFGVSLHSSQGQQCRK